MKKFGSHLFLAAAALICVGTLCAQAEKKAKGGLPVLTPPRLSPHEMIYVRVGATRPDSTLVSISYGRPYSAKGGKGETRKIWGELVKWNKADRLGSDEATTIMLEHPIEVQGKTIPAGVHTLYIVPSESGPSQLAFSDGRIGKWGIPVDEAKDIARVDLKKEELPEAVNQLTIVLENHVTTGTIKIQWEKTQYSVSFTPKR
jgi:hypothetical protein